jgi:hypothetical protein
MNAQADMGRQGKRSPNARAQIEETLEVALGATPSDQLVPGVAISFHGGLTA